MLLKNRTLLVGDVFERIKEIPTESIDCMITSPPYWQLRDYNSSKQFGHEPTFQEYLQRMHDLMTEVRRVLKSTGSAWVNMSDKYDTTGRIIRRKTRLGIPERFYIDCIDSGWIARNLCIWHKKNGKPEPYPDRLTNYSEPLMFFVKTTKYYFNLDPIRVAPKFKDSIPRKVQGKQVDLNGEIKDEGVLTGNSKHAGYKSKNVKMNADYSSDGAHYSDKYGLKYSHPKGSNPGNVWSINTKPYPGAHYATFPIELPSRIIKCACPEGGTVLDPFFGAGTTGVAAEQLGRKWIGIEINPEYAEEARQRLHKYRNNQL